MNAKSYIVSGGAAGAQAMSVSTDSARRTSPARKSQQKKVPKKRLNYNPREIRSALLRATRSQAAGNVLCQAKSQLANLAKCKGTGMYNESELSSAIIHARQMVRCAQLKTRNLKQEEQQTKKHSKQAKAEEQQQKNEIKRRVSQKERQLEQKMNLEKSQLEQKKQARIQEMMRRRRQHRNLERSKMDEADKEYQSSMGRAMREEAFDVAARTAFYPQEGVEMELSDMGIEMTEAQLEQQAEMMAAAEIASMGSAVSPDLGGGVDAASAPSMSADAAGAVIDIAVGGF